MAWYLHFLLLIHIAQGHLKQPRQELAQSTSWPRSWLRGLIPSLRSAGTSAPKEKRVGSHRNPLDYPARSVQTMLTWIKRASEVHSSFALANNHSTHCIWEKKKSPKVLAIRSERYHGFLLLSIPSLKLFSRHHRLRDLWREKWSIHRES